MMFKFNFCAIFRVFEQHSGTIYPTKNSIEFLVNSL